MEEIKYNGKFIQVKEKTIDDVVWEMAYVPDAVVVFPITKDNEIVMVVERRPHEHEETRLKFITGQIDPGETALETADREMQEEAGYKAAKLQEFMLHQSSGTINSNFHYILATELSLSKLPNPDGEDTIVEVRKVPLKKLKEMVYQDEMKWTLATLGLFKLFQKISI